MKTRLAYQHDMPRKHGDNILEGLMKFASRFGMTAIVGAALITVVSCTSKSPNGSESNNLSPQTSSGPFDPVPDDSAAGSVIPCELSLVDPTAEIQANTIPFKFSCENMGPAMSSITSTSYNRFGCLTRLEGTIYFKKERLSFTFEIQINRTLDGADHCAKNGGYIKV